ncbi:hypothetical protein, conserved [Trypanosoma brucei gambiense DAL972]|uniref:Mitochondrial RNA binding protein n=2 Tax=Trypanosoma brucei TaxID=5691 RepID=D0AAT0_TRYB9|nr:hypothetical protein, conserved [Trypanosoma brucei gambiense DAL972]RHW67889.1 mitochondrial RNA binding protein [Trypanosoma brucei equiperdum]CBH18781.1 hypothetical protein, conserved [Trypanosoma brucei gambiense DAL972]|eukprot:XP_011781045.1 hypothetical protein, conserved [Trypanosoma brucei gambiense DAL972]
MSNPFEKVARGIAFKMRSKVHKQGYSNTVMAQQARRLSPTGLLAMERLTELTALQQRHQCTFDPALRSKATQILRTLPLLSIDEDPYFTHTQRALRLAAYFGAVDLPVTYALINQHTKNAFMLDAFSMASFFYTLAKLKHPQTKEIVGILLPRLREVAPELIAREAVHILRLLCSIQMADAQLVKVVTETVVATAADVPLRDARQCAFILSETFPEEAQRILGAVEHRLCDDIDMNADANEVKTTILDVCRVVSATCKGPRRLLNSVARRSMELLPQLTPLDVAFVVKAFHLSSYRHLRLLRVLSSSLAASFPTSNVTKEHGLAASIVVQSLAHFYLSGCEEVVVTLVNASVNVLEGLNLALTLLACVRLRCVSPGVDPAVDALCSGAPMRRYVHNAHSMQVTSRILYGLAHAGRCRSDEEVAIVLPLLKSVVRTPGALRDDCRGFLLDAVTALGADGECSNDALQEQVRKVYERLSQDGGK